MTSTVYRVHTRALTEVFELVLLASVIALLADTGWVFHDILTNGLGVQYIFIASGLVSASVITIFAFIKHHRSNYCRIYKETLKNKLDMQYYLNRHRREE